jgi:hypothetical protein
LNVRYETHTSNSLAFLPATDTLKDLSLDPLDTWSYVSIYIKYVSIWLQLSDVLMLQKHCCELRQKRHVTVVTSWLANSILPFDFALLLPSVKPAAANLRQSSQSACERAENNGNEQVLSRHDQNTEFTERNAPGSLIRVIPLKRVAKQDLLCVRDPWYTRDLPHCIAFAKLIQN